MNCICLQNLSILIKAFDTIDYRILLHTLCGIMVSVVMRILQDNLSKRIQYTSIINQTSDIASITYDVPRPTRECSWAILLFLIYMNDLVNCSTSSCFVLLDHSRQTTSHVGAQRPSEVTAPSPRGGNPPTTPRRAGTSQNG